MNPNPVQLSVKQGDSGDQVSFGVVIIEGKEMMVIVQAVNSSLPLYV